MNISRRTFTQGLIACMIRLWLMSSQYQSKIAERVEVSTPLNSWKRVTEGVYLLNENVNPYMGDLIHEPPINLYFFKYLINWCDDFVPCIFVFADVITSVLLYVLAKKYLRASYDEQTRICKKRSKKLTTKEKSNTKHSQAANIFLKPSHINLFPLYVVLTYLFNPFIILNCVAKTTTVFNNLFLASYLCAMVHERAIIACFCLALLTTHSLYPVIFISPFLIIVSKKGPWKIAHSLFLLSYFILALLYASFSVSGSWSYMENNFGLILNVSDLRPNIGIFWYFFTEMFEHFRALFISTFQINVLCLYVVPLTIRFRRDPVFLAMSLILLTTIFKSYPSLGDVGFCIALLPIWMHLFSYLQQGFLVTCCFLINTILGPVVWYLWIYSRSANANFYFGATLSFASAQIFLITDVLFAYIKREFWLKNNRIKLSKSTNIRLVLE